MKDKIRILLLEDTPDDAELIQMQLREAGLSFVSIRVETKDTFEKAIVDFQPDIILSDYRLPSFDGRTALDIAKKLVPHVPVIMVTGAVGDELAVDLLKAGARDYILKDRLARLPVAVKRALREEEETQQRRQAEIALRESEELYKSLLAASPDGVTVVDDQGSVYFASRKTYNLLNADPQKDLRDSNCMYWIAPEDRERAGADLGKLLTGTTELAGEYRVLRADGTSFYAEISGAPLLDSENRPSRVVTVVRDVTSRRETMEALRQSETLHRSVITAMDEGVIVQDTTGKITAVNPAAERIHGRPAEEMLGRKSSDPLWQAIHEDGSPFPWNDHPSMITLKTGSPQTNVVMGIQRPDRSLVWISVNSQPLIAEPDPRPYAVVTTYHDITERKRAELSLRRFTRALRTLSSGNETLVRATNEYDLLDTMCHVLIEQGGYRTAWIGYLSMGENPAVRPVAWAGHEEGIFSLSCEFPRISMDRGPIATAIRNGTPCITHDIAGDDLFAPCREEAIAAGFKSSVTLPLMAEKAILGTVTIYSGDQEAFDDEEVKLLAELAGDLSYGIYSLRIREDRERNLKRLQAAMETTIQALASTVELRDPYTAGHQRRVARLAAAIAKEMGLKEEEIQGITFAGIVHDVGKIYVPAEVLARPGKLTAVEYNLAKMHVDAGYEILKPIDFPWPLAEIVHQHHERLDGSGYPRGLKGDEIMLASRILAVSDVVEAISSHRPYRPALGIEAALTEMEAGSGTHYDADVVAACVRVFKERGFQFD